MATQYSVVNDIEYSKESGMTAFILRPHIDVVTNQTELVDISGDITEVSGIKSFNTLDFSQL